jgi:hypothetical protein
VNTEVFMIPGQPEKVAARAALRLAWLGDQIEPVSPTEFIWKPQPAERKLFRCPPWVEVECLAAPSQPGHVLVRLRWKPESWLARYGAGMAALVGAMVGAFLLRGGPLLSLAGAAVVGVPLLVGIALGWGLNSSAIRRIRSCCQQGGTLSLEALERADHWLELDGSGREEVLRELRRRAAEAPLAPGQISGRDERSAATWLGWPLWHVAWGTDPVTGRTRVARGWYAKGQIAEGLVAVGQLARGFFAFGQLAIGKFVAVGQGAFAGLIALGQVAVGGLVGVGQVGAGLVAMGMGALGILAAFMGHADFFLAPVLVGLASLGVPLALLGAFSLRSWLRRAESQVLEEEIALAEEGRPPRPGETALSRVRSRPLPHPDERSLSVSGNPAEAEEERMAEPPERLAEAVEEEPPSTQRVDRA